MEKKLISGLEDIMPDWCEYIFFRDFLHWKILSHIYYCYLAENILIKLKFFSQDTYLTCMVWEWLCVLSICTYTCIRYGSSKIYVANVSNWNEILIHSKSTFLNLLILRSIFSELDQRIKRSFFDVFWFSFIFFQRNYIQI